MLEIALLEDGECLMRGEAIGGKDGDKQMKMEGEGR